MDILNGYELLERLGSGGAGVVYRARDARRGGTVALKLLPPEVAGDAALRAQLATEARAAADLDHPNVARVFGLEESERGPVLVMECLSGTPVDVLLRSGPLPFERASQVALQASAGLAAAHRAGVVHCDVKPANLFVTDAGGVKILDFGLARLRRIDEVPRSGSAFGTVTYMAPEQVRGQAVGPGTDVWALAATLWEMLAGSPLFDAGGDLAATILRIVSQEPESIEARASDVPQGLDDVLVAALEKDPAERYPTMEAFADALRELRSGNPPRRAATPVRARPSGGRPSPAPAASRAVPIPTNVHRLASPTLGRDPELAIIDQYLADRTCRILTVLGPGGMGKSHLALQAARRQLDAGGFPDGIHVVAMEYLSDAGQVIGAIAEAIGIRFDGPSSPIDQLVRAIGDERRLLLLDNHEHVMDAAALEEQLARACPNLTLLITSRDRLDSDLEWILPLRGLGFPDPLPDDLAEARRYGAVALFEHRARVTRGDFELAPDHLPALARLHRVLQGLPLGIEMVSSWVRLLTPSEIADRVEEGLELLETVSRDAPARHRSIRAVFDYSWDLLSDGEQESLRRLAVLRGGITATSSGALGVSGDDLATLADRSLLSRDADGRFSMQPLLHRYATARLTERPDLEASVRDLHSDHFLGLLADRGTDLRSASQREALADLVEAKDNLRFAWIHGAKRERTRQLVASAEPYRLLFDRRGLIQEGIEQFRLAAEVLPEGSLAWAHVCVHQAWLVLYAGDHERAERLVEASLARLDPRDAPRAVALGLNVQGALAAGAGRVEASAELFRRALELARRDEGADLVAGCLDNLATAEMVLGDTAAAERHYREALASAESLGNQAQVVLTLNNLGNLLMQREEYEDAMSVLDRGLVLAQDVGMARLEPYFLANRALASSARGELDRALEDLKEALRRARGQAAGGLAVGLQAELGYLLLRRGEPDEAEDVLLATLAQADELGQTTLAVRAVLRVGELELSRGRSERGRELVGLAARHPSVAREDREHALSLLGPDRPPGDHEESVPELERVVTDLLASRRDAGASEGSRAAARDLPGA